MRRLSTLFLGRFKCHQRPKTTGRIRRRVLVILCALVLVIGIATHRIEPAFSRWMVDQKLAIGIQRMGGGVTFFDDSGILVMGRWGDKGGPGWNDDELAEALSIVRAQERPVVVLDLQQSAVTDSGLSLVSQLSQLRTLRLSMTDITDDGLVRLQHLPALETLDLYGCHLVKMHGLKNLRALPKLRRLDVRGTGFSSEEMVHLRLARSLEYLALGDVVSVRDDDFNQLTDCLRLRVLDLSGADVTDEALVHLEKLPSLKELYLQNTLVSDAGISTLSRMTTVRELVIDGTYVSEKGLQELKEALPEATVSGYRLRGAKNGAAIKGY